MPDEPVVADNEAPLVETPPTEAEPKEQPKAEETQPKPKTHSISNPLTGESVDLTPQQIIELAEWSLMKNTELNKEEETKPKEDVSLQEQLDKLKEEISQKEKIAGNKERGQQIINTINKAAQDFELTRDNGPFAEKIKMNTLIRLNQNPRLDPAVAFAEETKSYMEILEKMNEKNVANDKVKGAIGGSLRGGSMPAIDTNKKWTAQDLKTSDSLEAMRLFIESQQ